MKYYVKCKNCLVNIYLNFGNFYPASRDEIREKYPFSFLVECINNHSHYYVPSDVIAEARIFEAMTSGAVLGAILYFVHPVAGALGAVGGPVLARNAEERNTEAFNRSS